MKIQIIQDQDSYYTDDYKYAFDESNSYIGGLEMMNRRQSLQMDSDDKVLNELAKYNTSKGSLYRKTYSSDYENNFLDPLQEQLLDETTSFKRIKIKRVRRYIQQEQTKISIIALIMIISAPILASLIGPFTYFLQTQNPINQLIWMNQGALLALLAIEILFTILRFLSFYPLKNEQLFFLSWLNPQISKLLILYGISYTFQYILFLIAIKYTLFSHAYLLFNIQPPFIIIINYILCKQVNNNELLGALIVILGIIFLNFDYFTTKTDNNQSYILFGNIIALFAGLIGIFTLYINTTLDIRINNKRQIILSQLFFSNLIMIIICLFPLIFSQLQYDIPNFSKYAYGIFGWLQPDNFLFCFLIMGILLRIGNQICYSYSQYNFSNIVIINICLIEPIISEIAGVLLHIDEIPKLFTYIGFVIVIFGMYILSKEIQDDDSEY